MNALSPKERLLRTFSRRKVDRPPVICTGGMMNSAIVEVMDRTGHELPAGHFDQKLMADLAAAVQAETGFENIGVPFCMTAEAEVLGSEIDFGSLICEPKIASEVFPSVAQVRFQLLPDLLRRGRIAVISEAVSLLAARQRDVPVVGSLTGPVSTAASIVDPMQFLRELRKDPQGCHRVLTYVSEFLVAYGRQMAEAGATAICIGDPTATGEILGPRLFREYALRYLNQVIDGLHCAGVPVIVHVCGDLQPVRSCLPDLHADAVSTDAMVNLKQLKRDFPGLVTMGNLSTFLLEFGPVDRIASQTRNLVADGIDIISPACGLSTSTQLRHIHALTGAVREGLA
jgi:[methyl-Co(III) methanol-specific corrinoid protein]:coenzyme M methyltransferase